MECKTIQEMLPAYHDRELKEAVFREIEEHLTVCESCRKVNVTLMETWHLLTVWEDCEPPQRIATMIVSGIAEQRKIRWVKIVLPVAAGLLIVIGLTFRFAGLQNEEHMQMPLPEQVHLSTEHPDVNEDELIADLHILEDEEFFDTVEELVKIDYLPLVDEPKHIGRDKQRSSLDMILT